MLCATGLLGTIGLLIWNEGEGKNYRSKHKEAGEKYLAIHKSLRSCFFLRNCDSQEVEQLSNLVSEIDKSEKPEISSYARKWAKNAIEKEDTEVDKWYLEKQKYNK